MRVSEDKSNAIHAKLDHSKIQAELEDKGVPVKRLVNTVMYHRLADGSVLCTPGLVVEHPPMKGEHDPELAKKHISLSKEVAQRHLQNASGGVQ